MHPEIVKLINGPIANAVSLGDAINSIDGVKAIAESNLLLKNKSISNQDSYSAAYQDEDYVAYREADYIRECLVSGEWHTHFDYKDDYDGIKTAVELVKAF